MVQRLAPDLALPKQCYVPGLNAHPESFPSMDQIRSISNQDLRAQKAYLYGWDLANHGFYWESHEAWELAWNDWGRTTPKALFTQGLIFLAAACLKDKSDRKKSSEKLAKKAKNRLISEQKTAQKMGICAKDLLKNWELTRSWPIYTVLPTCF